MHPFRNFLFCLACCLLSAAAAAQGVGIGTTTPHPSAALDIRGGKGLLIPKMNANNLYTDIPAPANGLLVYDTVYQVFLCNTGTTAKPNWQPLLNAVNGWTTSGNDYTTATDVLGTNNGQPLRIVAKGIERIHIDTSGKVGIGTTAPQAPLHVAAVATGNEALRLQAANFPFLSFRNGSNTPLGQVWANSSYLDLSTPLSSGRGITLTPDGATLMTLIDGHVGVGTATTNSLMELNTTTSGPSTNPQLTLRGNANTVDMNAYATANGASVQANGYNFISQSAVPNELYIQPGGGNIGIGTTAPAASLHLKSTGTTAKPNLIIEQSNSDSVRIILRSTLVPGGGWGIYSRPIGVPTVNSLHFINIQGANDLLSMNGANTVSVNLNGYNMNNGYSLNVSDGNGIKPDGAALISTQGGSGSRALCVEGNGAGTSALDIENGGIKAGRGFGGVGHSPVFQMSCHIADTAHDQYGNPLFVIDNPYSNGDPNAMLFVTLVGNHNYSIDYYDLYYAGPGAPSRLANKWVIQFHKDYLILNGTPSGYYYLSSNLTLVIPDCSLNVMVVNKGS